MSVDNFTASLIEMAEAVKAKPELEAQIAALKAELEVCHSSLAIKSDKINYLEADLAEAKAKREEAIRDRDEVSFRNLELEEKLDTFASMAGKVLGMVKPTPAPAPEPTPSYTPYGSLSEASPGANQDIGLPSWDIPSDSPMEVPAEGPVDSPRFPNTLPGSYHEYPYSWKPASMSDEEWAFGGGRPGPDSITQPSQPSEDRWPF